jgi:hypothetical protein
MPMLEQMSRQRVNILRPLTYKRSCVRKTMARAFCSGDLGSTKRMVGRGAASAIASAATAQL